MFVRANLLNVFKTYVKAEPMKTNKLPYHKDSTTTSKYCWSYLLQCCISMANKKCLYKWSHS